MKNIIISTILIIASNLQINAQKSDYLHLLDTGKIWHTVKFGEYGGIEAYSTSVNYENPFYANDTIYYSIDGWIIIREDTITKKVYKRNFDGYGNPSEPEEIIYDFSLQEGDSICINDYSDCWYYIDSIKTEDFYGYDRMVWYISSKITYDGVHHFHPVWVEGIGSLAGIQNFVSQPSLIWDEAGELTCCYLNESLLYQSVNGEYYGCSFEYLDTSPPIIDSIWFTPDTIASNDTVTLYIKATDNISGVKSFVTEIEQPNGSSLDFDFNGNLINEGDDIYSAKLKYYNWNEIGKWYTNFVVLYDSAGNEGVKYFDYNAGFYVNNVVNIKNHDIYNVKLYPNPINNISKLIFPNPKHKMIRVEIFDVLGELVYKQQTNQNQFIIKTYNLKSGMYLLKLSDNQIIIYTGKFIIK